MKQIARPMGRPVAERLDKMFDCAFRLLQDQCPKEPDMYLCMETEDYDDTACERCWSTYLYKVVNGQW